jgi:hypothetical protein
MQEVSITMMEDVLPHGKLKVSSNDAMSNSLTDKSTETFWESRDEARAKSKQITVTFETYYPVFGVAVHVDNQKDAGVSVKERGREGGCLEWLCTWTTKRMDYVWYCIEIDSGSPDTNLDHVIRLTGSSWLVDLAQKRCNV